ncbi:hypothetical protein RCL1_004828 [Eukaryota sp. TZLM3-RCL]
MSNNISDVSTLRKRVRLELPKAPSDFTDSTLYNLPPRTSIYDPKTTNIDNRSSSIPTLTTLSETTLLGTLSEFNESHKSTILSDKNRCFGELPQERQSKQNQEGTTTLSSLQSFSTQLSFSTMTSSVNVSKPHEPTADLATTLKTVKEHVEQGKKEEEDFINSLQPSEKTVYLREQRALDKYNQMKSTWSKFQENLAQKLKKDPDSLVMSRADTWRSVVEQRSILSAAQPKSHHSESSWQHSLRGGGPSFVPISSNPFAGLYCPIMQTQKPKQVELIRNPGHEMKNKKFNEKSGKRVGYLEERRSELARNIQKVKPCDPNFERLTLSGESLLTDDKLIAEFDLFLKKQQEAINSDDSDNDETDENDSDSRKRLTVKNIQRQLLSTMSEYDRPIKNEEELISSDPSIKLSKSLVVTSLIAGLIGFSSKVETIIIQNTSKLVLNYHLSRKTKTKLTASQSTVLINQNIPLNQRLSTVKNFVFCPCPIGIILPGESKEIPFSIKCNDFGFFEEFWTLSTTPRLPNPITISFKIVAGSPQTIDGKVVINQILEKRMERRGVEDIVFELINNLPLLEFVSDFGSAFEDLPMIEDGYIESMLNEDDLFIEKIKSRLSELNENN